MHCRLSYRYCIRPHNTYICHYDHDPRHEVCSDLVNNPADRFAHDAAQINQRFFTICATFLYIDKGITINTTLVVYVNIRTALCGIFFGVSGHRIDTNQPVHISWLKLLVSVINELSCMKLIARAEQIGLTWPDITRRV